MEFFDKLTKKASETYKGAAEKTSKIAKETKLKIKISDNKSKIEDLYQEIGKKVYQKHTADEELNIKADLAEECDKIDILAAEIETYHDEIRRLSNEKVCINCKETMDKDAKFCPHCGAEQPEVKEESEAIEAEVVVEEQETNSEDAQEEANESEKIEENNTSEEAEQAEERKEDVEPEKVEYTEGEDVK